jgi:hypothetical protein
MMELLNNPRGSGQWWLVILREPFESQEMLLAAATKQRAREGTADWEDLVCTVVRYRMRELMTAL